METRRTLRTAWGTQSAVAVLLAGAHWVLTAHGLVPPTVAFIASGVVLVGTAVALAQYPERDRDRSPCAR